VTADDMQRVAHDVIAGNGLNLAVIGAFEEAERERFERKHPRLACRKLRQKRLGDRSIDLLKLGLVPVTTLA
jgi:hypothetical protein